MCFTLCKYSVSLFGPAYLLIYHVIISFLRTKLSVEFTTKTFLYCDAGFISQLHLLGVELLGTVAISNWVCSSVFARERHYDAEQAIL